MTLWCELESHFESLLRNINVTSMFFMLLSCFSKNYDLLLRFACHAVGWFGYDMLFATGGGSIIITKIYVREKHVHYTVI